MKRIHSTIIIMLRNILFFTSILLTAIVISCSSDNGEDILEEIKFDCSQSDLALSIQSQTDPTCTESGSIVVTSQGGTAPISFTLDGNPAQADGTFENLNGGTYSVMVTDANECSKTVSVTLASDTGFTASATSGDCGDNNIVITAIPEGTYTYSLNGGEGQSENTFEGLAPGTYEVVVTDDGGCTSTLSNIVIEASVSLSTDVMPIITANCAIPSCHGGSRSPNLSGSTNIIASANRIKARTSAGTMPPSGSLPQTQVDLIANWVDCGAEDN